MKIGIDASNLRAGGGITHLVELLRAADPLTHGFEQIIVWGGAGTLVKLKDQKWLCKIHDPLLDRGLPYRLFWQRFLLKKQAEQSGCDVLFVPGGVDSSGFKPMVTMSRNMLPFEWREMRRYGLTWGFLRNVLLHYSQTRTFHQSDGLIFLTRYARDVVMKVVGQSRGRVAIIPHGVDESFSLRPRAQRSIGEFTAASPFRLLYVSLVDAYKHQWHVAQAAAQLRAAGFPITLDFVGPASSRGMRRLTKTLQCVDPEARFIHYRGSVPHEALQALYAGADLNVFASSCENMPNILLEGMASGLPIACSNYAPMPEVLGDAGVYFDPERPDDISKAIRLLIESPELRMEKARAAHERVRQYSWRRCATETFAFIAQTASAA